MSQWGSLSPAKEAHYKHRPDLKKKAIAGGGGAISAASVSIKPARGTLSRQVRTLIPST